MSDAPLNGTILLYLANEVRRVANELGRITDAVYGMDDPVIRENLEQLKAVERSLRSLATAAAQPDPV